MFWLDCSKWGFVFSKCSIFWLSYLGYADSSRVLGSTLWTEEEWSRLRFFLQQFGDTAPLPLASPVAPECVPSHPGDARFSPSKTCRLETSGSFPSVLHHWTLWGPLSPTFPCCAPASKFSVWSVAALSVACLSACRLPHCMTCKQRSLFLRIAATSMAWRTLLCRSCKTRCGKDTRTGSKRKGQAAFVVKYSFLIAMETA